MPKLSVTVVAKNEAVDLGAALASVAWADEIVVVDCGSTDDTVAIAREFTPRVIVEPWPGYAAQKNFAATQASHDWILSLDAEAVEPVVIVYVNRLSDLLFTMARAANHRAGATETPW